MAFPKKIHVSGAYLPTAATSPATIEGLDVSANSISVDALFLTNTEASTSHVATITDLNTPAFSLSWTLTAGQIISLQLFGIKFQGGFKWSAAPLSATDLAVDGTNNKKVTSASHNFVTADVGKVVHITAGAGFTPGDYLIDSVSSNAAILHTSPGATSITAGSYTLPMVSGAIVGER